MKRIVLTDETGRWFDEEITNEEAARWLSINGNDPHEACEKEYAELEIG
jgi:hypothetical protein